MIGLEHLVNCHGEWLAFLSLLGMIPLIGPWLRSKLPRRGVSMKISAVLNDAGGPWFQCPECDHRNDIDPDLRISDLTSKPQKCCGCKVDIVWHRSGDDQGMASFGEMAARRIRRRVLPFKKKSS
jgi:hypothetical protein